MGFFGDIIGGALGFLGGERSNDSSARQAAQANQFTERMMKNRHQWQVADLRAAGLNPILSAGGTPSVGGSAQAQQHDTITPAINTALSSRRLQADLKNIQADTQKKKAEAAYADNLGAKAAQDYRRGEWHADIGDIASQTSQKMKRVASSAAGAAREFSKHPARNLKYLRKKNR